jgi:ubiquinone biosynthesis protein
VRGPHNIWRLIRTGATLRAHRRDGRGARRAPGAAAAADGGAGARAGPSQWLGYRGDPALPPATRALTALGPAYIKFGQILSTRPDVVGNELAMQLRVLQDKLPPFPTPRPGGRSSASWATSAWTTSSRDFSEPVAAASIAQVHKRAAGRDRRGGGGQGAAPGDRAAFRTDIDAFYLAARMIEMLAPSARRLRPMDVIAHFEGVVMGELDLRLETSSAAEFAANTAKDEGFRVPARPLVPVGAAGDDAGLGRGHRRRRRRRDRRGRP